MKILSYEKIRTSYSTKLSLWVYGFVLVITGVVIFLLVSFSEDVIRDETIDTTLQALENTALRIDNTLRQSEITARMEHEDFRINRARIERLVEENGYLASIHQFLPNAQLYVTRRDSSQLGIYFAGNGSGYRQMEYEGNDIYIFSHPVGEQRFNLSVVTPSQDIHNKYSRIKWYLLMRGAVVILVLLFILYIVIGRHLRPLHRLADSAQGIADGALDTAIPDSPHHDEIGRLQNSLSMMQRKLAAYMDEMQQKQATLERQNTDLQALYSEAQAYEDMKSKFLHDMTGKMAQPVEKLCRCTDALCRFYPTLSDSDVNNLHADISQCTETIVSLLDQLIKKPATA